MGNSTRSFSSYTSFFRYSSRFFFYDLFFGCCKFFSFFFFELEFSPPTTTIFGQVYAGKREIWCSIRWWCSYLDGTSQKLIFGPTKVIFLRFFGVFCTFERFSPSRRHVKHQLAPGSLPGVVFVVLSPKTRSSCHRAASSNTHFRRKKSDFCQFWCFWRAWRFYPVRRAYASLSRSTHRVSSEISSKDSQ